MKSSISDFFLPWIPALAVSGYVWDRSIRHSGRLGDFQHLLVDDGGAGGVRVTALGTTMMLVDDGRITVPVALQRLRQVAPCPDRFPRRVGIPVKRPLFRGST